MSDAVIIGSGINSLTAAALLARAGWSVTVVERNDRLGGAIRTSTDLTLPGFTHEVLSSWHPLFQGSPAYAELADDLGRHGLEYLNCDLPTGSLFPDGSAAFLATSLEANVAELDRLGRRRRGLAGPVRAVHGLGRPQLRRARRRALVAAGPLARAQRLPLARPPRACSRSVARRSRRRATGSRRRSRSEGARGLLAPWVLHTGLGPDQAVSGFMTQVIGCAVQLGGMPVPRGGGIRLVEALAAIVREHGGELRTSAEATRIVVSGGRATGVRLASGETLGAARAVLASVTPTALYGSLLEPGARRPPPSRRRGRSATAAPACRSTSRSTRRPCGRRPSTSGSRAPRSCTSRPGSTASRVPSTRPSAGCCRPRRRSSSASRAPSTRPGAAGRWIIWIQLQELPRRAKGDALGQIDVGDGSWTEALREAYADRIMARGSSQRRSSCGSLKRVVLSPADLEALDCNLVGGDIYSGSCALDQNLLWRPSGDAARPPHPGRRALADRRVDAPGPGARRGLGVPRREGAHEGAAAAARLAKVKERLPR